MGARRTRAGWLAIVVLLAALGVAACGDDDGDSPFAAPDEQSDSGGGDGGDDSSAGSGSGDEDDSGTSGDSDGSGGSDDTGGDDFPIPAPDGLLLDALDDAGVPQANQRQLFYPDGDFDRLVAFYDDWTSQGGEWARTELEGELSFLRVDGEFQTITITSGFDPGAQADGPVTLLILVTG